MQGILVWLRPESFTMMAHIPLLSLIMFSVPFEAHENQ